jgi:hypothetical protein
MRRHVLAYCIFVVLSVTGCGAVGGIAPPPDLKPAQPNVVSLAAQDWYVYYSNGVPPHPSAASEVAWALDLPATANDGHVNYIQTPFNLTEPAHSMVVTFEIKSTNPEYHVTDSTDHLPATIHFLIEKTGDDLRDPNGRWWAQTCDTLGADGQTFSVTIPLTPDLWTNVDGQQDSKAFYDALENIGWVGLTFGGQYFAGHGVSLDSGSAQIDLIEFMVD